MGALSEWLSDRDGDRQQDNQIKKNGTGLKQAIFITWFVMVMVGVFIVRNARCGTQTYERARTAMQ